MKFTIKRTATIETSITITKLDINKLKPDLISLDYLDEMDNFETEDELIAIIRGDQNAASLVFYTLNNSAGYEPPTEVFLGDEKFKVE